MSKVFTYQTRLPESSCPALDAYAMLYGQGERKLFAAMQSGRGTVNQLKRDCLCRFGITARQFNAVRVGLEGKVASIQERRPELISEAGQRIRKAERVIAKLDAQIGALRDPVKALMAGRPVKPVVPGLRREKLAAATSRRHHKMRRLAILRHRLQALKSLPASASAAANCSARSSTWKRTVTLPMTNGWPTGAVRAATRSSCWAVAMKQRDARDAWPVRPATVRLRSG